METSNIKQISHFDTMVTVLKNLSINLKLDDKYKEKFDNLAQSCFNYWNFIIIPIKKITKKTVEYNKETIWECYIINSNNKTTKLYLDAEILSNWSSFENLLMNHENYYFKMKGSYSTKIVKDNLICQKRMIDFVSWCAKIVDELDEYNRVWFYSENTVVYNNGILNLETKTFQEKSLHTEFSNSLKYNNYEKSYSITDAINWLSNTIDNFVINKKLNFLLKWYLISSVFRNEIFGVMKSFPIFYMSWLRWTGKTFLFWLIKRIVWFEDTDTTSIWWSTLFPLKQQLDQINFYNFLDECQKMTPKHVEIFKWNYDNHKISRGSISKKGPITIQSLNQSVLFLWWESLTGEEALQSRCLIHGITNTDIKNLEWDEVETIIHDGNQYFQEILRNKKDIDVAAILDQSKKFLQNYDCRDNRKRNNLIMILFGHLLISENVDPAMIDTIIKDHFDSNDGIEETLWYSIVEDITNNFTSYASILNYHKDSKVPLIHIANHKLFLNIKPIVENYRLRNRENFNSNMIYPQLCELLGIKWTTLKKQYKRFYLYDGSSRDCFAVSLEDVKSNLFLSRIWNQCIFQLKKDYTILKDYISRNEISINEDDAFSRMMKRQNQRHEETVKIEDYKKIVSQIDKIITDNQELQHFQVDITNELQEIIIDNILDFASISNSHYSKKTPAILYDNNHIYINIEDMTKNLQKHAIHLSFNTIQQLLEEEINQSTPPCSLQFIGEETDTVYRLVNMHDTNIIPNHIRTLLLVQYYNDKLNDYEKFIDKKVWKLVNHDINQRISHITNINNINKDFHAMSPQNRKYYNGTGWNILPF